MKFGQADDLSKIRGRFKTKLTLASAGVEEVIQRRLLAKILDEPDQLIAIYEQEERFKADVDFQKRDSQQQQEVLRPTSAAKADVQAAAKPGTALLRLNRYRTDDVPKQLQRIAALAAPPDSPPDSRRQGGARLSPEAELPFEPGPHRATRLRWIDA